MEPHKKGERGRVGERKEGSRSLHVPVFSGVP